MSSAKGTASHTPVIPMIIGRSTMLATIKTKVQQKEIMAEMKKQAGDYKSMNSIFYLK